MKGKIQDAKTIIASLWKVLDHVSQEFMVEFYKGLMVFKNKYLAYNNAQKTIMKRYSDPIFWGGFIMID